VKHFIYFRIIRKTLINNIMPTLLNTEKLSTMLKSKRGEKGLRAVAQEIGGVSASTLSRIEQGKVPDVDTFIKICSWLGVSTEEFSSEESNISNNISSKDLILSQLRADRTLSQKTIEALAEMINLAYNKY
jgi:DNA-binding XRE family transcriptional regulator